MNKRIYDSFDNIKADDELKEKTLNYIKKKKPTNGNRNVRKLILTFASLFCLIILGTVSYNMYFTGIAYIDIDVNPSIELVANRFGRIIEANAYNKDGEAVLEGIEIKNRTYEEAIDLIVNEMIDKSYIQDAELFTATLQMDGTNAKKWLSSLTDYVESSLEKKNIATGQEIFEVNADVKQHSHEQNMTPAKYIAVMAAQEVDPELTFDDCRDKSIGEIKEHMHNYNENEGSHGDGHGESH